MPPQQQAGKSMMPEAAPSLYTAPSMQPGVYAVNDSGNARMPMNQHMDGRTYPTNVGMAYNGQVPDRNMRPAHQQE